MVGECVETSNSFWHFHIKKNKTKQKTANFSVTGKGNANVRSQWLPSIFFPLAVLSPKETHWELHPIINTLYSQNNCSKLVKSLYEVQYYSVRSLADQQNLLKT